jgi:hypothetical protein
MTFFFMTPLGNSGVVLRRVCMYPPPHVHVSSSSYACIFLQVLSGDGWSDLARSLFPRGETGGARRKGSSGGGGKEEEETDVRETDSSVAFFFVSYMLINSIMLLNVVVAVLLVPLFTYTYAYAYAHAYTYAHTYTYEHAYTSCICIRIYTGRVHFKCDARKAGGGARDTCRAGQTQTAAHILERTPYSGFI